MSDPSPTIPAQPNSSSADAASQVIPPWVSIGSGFLALAGLFAFIFYLLSQTAASDLIWTREIYLYTGVEAIAFAAAGLFFGTTIQRQRAQSAEQRATSAEMRAVKAELNTSQTAAQLGLVQAEARVAKASGSALAAAIRAKQPTAGPGETAAPGGATLGAPPSSAEFADLVAIADAFFPPAVQE